MGHRRCPEEYSCPIIDSILEYIESMRELTLSLDMDGEMNSLYDEVMDKMEEVRAINHSLREWGCDEASQRDALEAEISCLKQELEI